MKLATFSIVIAIALQACSFYEPCVNQKITYQLEKIPPMDVKINASGGMDKENTAKTRSLVHKLRDVENYYYENTSPIQL